MRQEPLFLFFGVRSVVEKSVRVDGLKTAHCRKPRLERLTVFGEAVEYRELLVHALHALDHGNPTGRAHGAGANGENTTRA